MIGRGVLHLALEVRVKGGGTVKLEVVTATEVWIAFQARTNIISANQMILGDVLRKPNGSSQFTQERYDRTEDGTGRFALTVPNDAVLSASAKYIGWAGPGPRAIFLRKAEVDSIVLVWSQGYNACPLDRVVEILVRQAIDANKARQDI